jgi:predicted DNA-binding transcriptional regulator YafY
MRFTEYLLQLERIDRLIRLKATGTPGKLAQKLNVSERTLYNRLEDLKDLGAQIEYCKDNQSFRYKNHFDAPLSDIAKKIL